MPRRHLREQAPRGLPLLLVRVALLAGSCASTAYGVARGEVAAVLAKGVKVCLECIGIG